MNRAAACRSDADHVQQGLSTLSQTCLTLAEETEKAVAVLEQIQRCQAQVDARATDSETAQRTLKAQMELFERRYASLAAAAEEFRAQQAAEKARSHGRKNWQHLALVGSVILLLCLVVGRYVWMSGR